MELPARACQNGWSHLAIHVVIAHRIYDQFSFSNDNFLFADPQHLKPLAIDMPRCEQKLTHLRLSAVPTGSSSHLQHPMQYQLILCRSQAPEPHPNEMAVKDDYFETDSLANTPRRLVPFSGSERRLLSHPGSTPSQIIHEIRL